jgi:allantoinase
MTITLAVRNATVVTENTIVQGDVLIAGDRIAGIVGRGSDVSAEREIDASGRYVFPGFVDGHIHFRDPGQTHRGDFNTESISAVHGGVTTVIDGPNTGNVVRFAEDVEEKRRIGEAASLLDFGQMAALTPENVDAVPELVEAGVVAVKIFLGYKYKLSGLPLHPPEDGQLMDALESVRGTGVRLSVHAENGDVITHLRERFMAEGRNTYLDHLASRPAYGEADAISTILRFGRAAGIRMEIRHLSCQEGLPLVAAAKAQGLDIVLETCPHYLVLDDDDLREQGGLAVINPPVRGSAHQNELLQGIRDGIIDVIGTDHGPVTDDEQEGETIWQVAPGFSAVEVAVPLLLTLAEEGELSLTDIARLYSANTAKAWDLYPRKGSLQPGADADVTICDVGPAWTIDHTALHGRWTKTPFHGRTVRGRVSDVVVGGRIVIQDGALIDDEPRGRMVRPWFKGAYRFDQIHGPRRASGSVADAEALELDRAVAR